MARFRTPPFDIQQIAAQLEPFLRGPPSRAEGRTFGAAPNLGLAESIPMWRLEQDRLAKAQHLADAARFMQRWHHQIVAAGAPVAHAVSNEQTARLTTVEHGDAVARAIDEAIKKLDERNEFGDGIEVRFLAVPSYHLSALWLIGPGADEVYVLPETTPRSAENRLGLGGAPILPGDKFLDVLRSVVPIHGFTTDHR